MPRAITLKGMVGHRVPKADVYWPVSQSLVPSCHVPHLLFLSTFRQANGAFFSIFFFLLSDAKFEMLWSIFLELAHLRQIFPPSFSFPSITSRPSINCCCRQMLSVSSSLNFLCQCQYCVKHVSAYIHVPDVQQMHGHHFGQRAKKSLTCK